MRRPPDRRAGADRDAPEAIIGRFAGPSPRQERKTDTPEQLFEEILRFLWRSSPAQATAVGIHDHDDRLAEFDAAAITERIRRLRAMGRDLARLQDGPVALSPDELLDARVLRNTVEVEARLLEEMRAPCRDPGVYLDEILYGLYYLIQRDFTSLPERAWLAAHRLRDGARVLREGRANLARPEEIPQVWVEAALDQAAGSVDFFRQIEREVVPAAGSGGPDLGAALQQTAADIESFAAWLRSDRLPTARGDFAVGRPLFEFLLHRQHGLDLGAEELYRFGLDRVEQARARLEQEARGIDPGRSWQDLVALWKSEHPQQEEFVSTYRREVERAREFVVRKRLVTLPAWERLQVAETPPFLRGICPFAAYLAPGAFESNQLGTLWVTPPSEGASEEVRRKHLEDHLLAGIPNTTVHEAYPGHHLQLSVASRIASRVRRGLIAPVMVEGWGFYCEQMMAEEGYYADPRSRVLQLKDELWRSCRVVIDVGIQTRGLSLDEAIGMLHEQVRLGVPSAQGEVRRYSRMPTQPMSYAVGKHEILMLRDEYRRRRGPSFNLQEFHDRFLSLGSIPISMIRERILGGNLMRDGAVPRAVVIAILLSGALSPSEARAVGDSVPSVVEAAASPAPAAAPGGAAAAGAGAIEPTPPAMSENPLGPIPPDDPRMEAYSHGGYFLYVVGTVWGLVLLALIVATGFGAFMQRLAEHVTRRANLKVAVYAALFAAVTFLGSFPLTVYASYVREKRYGFANQTFGAWMGDQGKGLLIAILLEALFFTALYAVLRRLPRFWWVAGAALAILFVILVLAIAPVFIAPLFNTFEPLHDAALRDEILAMARAQGIPAHEVYQVDASRQSEHNNAYVAGLLGTQRVVIYDTLLKHFTPREIRFVMGHEMGHYVLRHIWKFVALLSVVIVIGFALVDRVVRAILQRAPRLGIIALHEPASLPLLLLLLNGWSVLATPALATFSRHEEHQADRFGLEVTGDPEAAASSFIKFGTYDLSEYEVDPWIETLLYDHPSPANRIRFAQSWAARHPKRRGGAEPPPASGALRISER